MECLWNSPRTRSVSFKDGLLLSTSLPTESCMTSLLQLVLAIQRELLRHLLPMVTSGHARETVFTPSLGCQIAVLQDGKSE